MSVLMWHNLAVACIFSLSLTDTSERKPGPSTTCGSSCVWPTFGGFAFTRKSTMAARCLSIPFSSNPGARCVMETGNIQCRRGIRASKIQEYHFWVAFWGTYWGPYWCHPFLWKLPNPLVQQWRIKRKLG